MASPSPESTPLASTVPFYAELLPNIRSISLSITPPSLTNASTRVVVPPGASSVLFHHNGHTCTMILPAIANPYNQEILIALPQGVDSISCRLPTVSTQSVSSNNTPWSATELSTYSAFHCRYCNYPTVLPGMITTWKDLPSGNWADMMDFWHCHKPHEKSSSGGGIYGKYAAFGAGFKVNRGTGLVDSGGFLFSKEDLQDSAKMSTASKLHCVSCDARLGHPDNKDPEIWRLHKWNLRLQLHPDATEAAYPLESFIAAQFLSHAESEGTRRLLVSTKDSDSSEQLKIWIFNTDIWFTHSRTFRPVRGMKIYWRFLQPGDEAPVTDRLTTAGFEAVELDDDVYQTLIGSLRFSNAVMPEDQRVIEDWSAGALRRFED